MIISLLYFITSRHVIALCIGFFANNLANSEVSNVKAVNRIFGFMYDICDFGFSYPYDTNANITGFSNLDWVSDATDRKDTLGGCSLWEPIWSLGIVRSHHFPCTN